MNDTSNTQKKPFSHETAFYIVGWCLIGVICIAVICIRFTSFGRQFRLPTCMLYAMTGAYCPGCGGTRATIYLFTGHPIKTLIYHPLVFYGAAVAGWFMLSQTIERISRHKLTIGMKYRDIYLWIALGIAIVNCIIKNVLLFVFDIDLLSL